VRTPRWITAVASLRYSDMFVSGKSIPYYCHHSDVAQFNSKAHGMAMCGFGSSTKNSNRFHWLGRYLPPVLSTPYNFLCYPKVHWTMSLGEKRNSGLPQRAQFNLHY
jgi:hypothetical protein